MDAREIEREVLAYLLQHPNAADTARGIAHWWLPRRSSADSPAAIDRALERLVAAGRLRAVKLPNGETLYQLGDATAPRRH